MKADLSIITPSYNMLGYLQRCCHSVADQADVAVEHLVIDGGSTDGTPAWLALQQHLRSVSEPDKGMYDAINKGLSMATGELIAYLNCDEQYLPGTLAFVANFFDQHPAVDVLFGDALLIRPDGSLIAYRKAYQPRRAFILTSHLYLLSCTMFFRRRVVDAGLCFDDHFTASGDQDFVLRLLEHRYRMTYARRYLSAFTMTGANLGASQITAQESQRMLEAAPRWLSTFRYPLNLTRRLEKLASGAYWQKMPLAYAVYVSAEDTERTRFSASSASFLWKAA